MSLALLLEEYDVSTEEGLEKALGEIEKEEAEVDEALSSALSRACDLEGRLRTASQAYSRLGEIKNDAQSASDMVDKTAALAKDVSAKVRQLDLARSRVAECQRRVHDLIDLQLCSAGVEAAIKAHDYETGAAHVARFLSMDPGSLDAARARGAPDPRHAMTLAADTLREHLVRKFEEAARKDDSANVERLFKLFPQIGRAEEGVDLLAKYISDQTDVAIKRACVVSESVGEAAVFADAFTRVLEVACAANQRARRLLAVAPALLPRGLAAIQPVVSAGGARVVRELERRRGLQGGAAGGAAGRAPASPLAAEPVLHELARAHHTVLLYQAFLRRNAHMDGVDEKTNQANLEAIEKIIAESDLTRTAQDLLGHYLKLERYFLEENVNKALKMATPQADSTTSNLVDDIFFIARKSIRRSVSTGSVEGVCAVLNEAGALELAAGALRAALAPRARAWAARLAAPAPLPHEELEEDADALPQALDVLVEDLRASLSARTAEQLLTALLHDLADTTDAKILQNHYDLEGGLAVERRVRRLAAWAGSNAPAARERLARLKQAAALLALERVAHARAALPPALVRRVLARRTDFKIEEINRLKL